MRTPQVALYLLDQDPQTTSSLGILNYTRNLIQGMAEATPPGFEVALWVSRANHDVFVPEPCPDWIKVVCVDGRFGTGGRRLVADHGVVVWLAQHHHPAVIHFPKGFLPACLSSDIHRVVTIHDTIISYYREHYPCFFPRVKTAYFQYLLRRSYRRAEQVITVSDFSAQCLREAFGDRSSLHVIPSAGFCCPGHPLTSSGKSGVFVIGSRMPHKATAETLRRLEAYAKATGFDERITLSGVQRLEDIPGFRSPFAHPVELVGRLPFPELQQQMAASRALVVLSEIEGFGLPLLEAYAVGTPVCFRNVASMREVLDGMPGAWDGVSDASFRGALDACLTMPSEMLAEIQRQLAARYDWGRAVANTLQVYRDGLGLVP